MSRKGITISELNKFISGISISSKDKERKDLLKIMTTKKKGKGLKSPIE
jgi:hypothetical protein